MDTTNITPAKASGKPKLNSGYTQKKFKSTDQKPQVAKLIFLLGAICLVLGAFLSMYNYKHSNDPMAFLYLVYGIIEFAGCAGLSTIICLLDEIRKNTDR